jgi:hypothetical protein
MVTAVWLANTNARTIGGHFLEIVADTNADLCAARTITAGSDPAASKAVRNVASITLDGIVQSQA